MDPSLRQKSIGDFEDDEGRLLAERGSEHAVYRQFDVQPCPYRDARFQKDMNVDALAQIRSHWSEIAPAIRQLVADAQRLSPAGDDTLSRLRRVTRTMGSLPEFMVVFLDAGNGDIPALVAILYKLSRGLNTLTGRLTFEPRRGPKAATPTTPDALYDYIDRHGLLVGSMEVCAGPRAMILRVLEALLDTPSDALRRPGDQGPLDRFFTEVQRSAAVRYGAGLSDHLVLKELFGRVFTILDQSRGTPPTAPRVTRGRLASLLTCPFISGPDLAPPGVDALLKAARREIGDLVTSGAADISDETVRRIDALWERTIETRRREIDEIARTLGGETRVTLDISDLPNRPERRPPPPTDDPGEPASRIPSTAESR